MIYIKKYSDDYLNLWNEFNAKSKNSMFMFDRNYMDYHRDRFKDHSLLFFADENLIALFPACEKDNSLSSHGGLTYGGFITNEKMNDKKLLKHVNG